MRTTVSACDASARRAPRQAMPGLRRALAIVVLPLLLLAPISADAADLRLAEIGPAGAAPAPDYPVPNDADMVLYLQRSTNPNTVVYAARFGADGKLDADDPLSAYWRRFNTDGDAKDLSMIERQMAYGVTANERAPGVYDVRFRAIPEIPLVLEQRGPGQAVLSITPQGQPIELTYGYLEVDEGGLVPSVTGIRLFGKRRSDGQPVELTYSVEGGQIAG